MALDTAPKLTRKKLVAWSLETTTGTAITLDAPMATVPAFDPTFQEDFPIIERAPQGASISPISQSALGAMSATCGFEIEMAGLGSGTPPLWFNLMEACGMLLTSSTLTPLSAAVNTVTVGYNNDGVARRISGAMGNAVFTLTAGEKGRVKFDFHGKLEAPGDETLFAPTYNATIAPRCGTTTMTVGGTAYKIPSLTLDMGNQVVLRRDLSGVNAAGVYTGYRAAMIVARAVVVKVNPELIPLATKDWRAIYASRATAALSAVVGGTSNNVFTIAAPKLQLNTYPGMMDVDGLIHDDLSFLAIRNTDAGDDEWSLVAS